jgi:hypothetical protein
MAPTVEQPAVDVTEQPGAGRLSEALAWADMEDDEPLFLPRVSLAAGTIASRVDLLQGWRPLEACTPSSQFVTAGVKMMPLAVTCEVPPQEVRSLRTPLSAKSTPFVSMLHLMPSPPSPGKQARHRGKRNDEHGKTQSSTASMIRTTVMLRGLPGNFSREMLIDLLDVNGYSRQFDLVYLPVDFESFEAYGFGFVNFTEPAIADRFKAFFDCFDGHPFSATQPSSTFWGRVQGLEANIEEYRNNCVMCEHVLEGCKPLLLCDGLPRPFPEPTVKLKEPKIRGRRDAA